MNKKKTPKTNRRFPINSLSCKNTNGSLVNHYGSIMSL